MRKRYVYMGGVLTGVTVCLVGELLLFPNTQPGILGGVLWSAIFAGCVWLLWWDSRVGSRG